MPIALSESVQPFAERVDAFREHLERVRASQDHDAIVELLDEARELDRLSRRVESGHLNDALDVEDLTEFDARQRDLRECRSRFAGLLLKAQEALFAKLSADVRRELSQMAMGELNAPLVDRDQLDTIRQGVAEVRSRRAGADRR